MYQEDNKVLMERYHLSSNRMKEIAKEDSVKEPYLDYFRNVATFLVKMFDLYDAIKDNKHQDYSMEKLAKYNKELYEDILVDSYESSYANPAYANKVLGDYGQLLSFLYTELRGLIVYAYEQRLLDVVICSELFVEIYNCFEDIETLKISEIKDIIYWYISDYSELTLEYRVREQVDYDLTFATNIITNSDLRDLRYLYSYGEYITENEIKLAEYLNNLSEEKIYAMARTYTEGFRLGFVNSGKNLNKKGSVNIRYSIGFEPIVKVAIEQFREMGLQPVIYRAAVNSINKKQHLKIGYSSTSPNKQYDYDHRFDQSIYLDKALNDRRLAVLKNSYEKYKEKANLMAGPAVIEIFGEKPFAPLNKPESYVLSEKQQKLSTSYANVSSQIVNEYIKGEERSFTIIAFPIPEIGEKFEEIFDETVKINTLDN